MKVLLLFVSLSLLMASKENCKNTQENLAAGCYKGRLEVKAECMNYTISMQSTNFDPSEVMPSWTDENTGKIYKNVFGLGSRCNFPDSLKAGDVFYFKIDSTTVQNCAVCMIYYPTPSKKLSIKVLAGPCTQ